MIIRKLVVVCGLFLCTVSHAKENLSHFVYNVSTQKTVSEVNPSDVKPMASLTKLMTALVVVESNPDWQEKIIYRGNVFYSKMVSKKDLFESLLIRSDNNAAEAFANAWPGGRTAFLDQLNEKARKLKMPNTYYADPSGLDKRNVSTAEELTKLVIAASKYPLIGSVSSSKYLTIEKKSGKKIRSVSLNNTNSRLLFQFDSIVLSKTGFTNPAGRCLALLVDRAGTKYAVVILGEKNIEKREEKARHLINDYATIQEVESREFEDRYFILNH